MRYKRIGIASWAIASSLVVVALLTALARSHPWAQPLPRAPVADQEAAVDWRLEGRQVFQRECASCHPGGEAVGRAIPPLRGRFVERFLAPGGRQATIDLLLLGSSLDGEEGAHPDYPELSDPELAALVEHMLVSWGNEALLPPDIRWLNADEIAARRP